MPDERDTARYRSAVAIALLALCVIDAACERRPQRQTVTSAMRVALAPSVSGLRGREADILQAWVQYLQSTAGSYAQAACRPSALWVASDQQRWPCYHLAGNYIADGAAPEILSIRRSTIGGAADGDDAYVVVTRFQEDSARSPTQSRTVELTVFAQRTGRDWKFSTALPRYTRLWERRVVGPFTYVIEPGIAFNRQRADSAVAFMDSIVAMFAVPRPAPLTYYLHSTMGAAFRAMGLVPDHEIGPVGALAQPNNQQLFSGIPALGENYRHELAHIALRPLLGNASYFVSEGVPTWLGGTVGMDFPAAARALAVFLDAHPTVTLDSILAGRAPQGQFYQGGAVFVQIAYERGGVVAVRALFDAGGEPSFKSAMERLFGEPWPAIARRWRLRAASYGDARRQ